MNDFWNTSVSKTRSKLSAFAGPEIEVDDKSFSIVERIFYWRRTEYHQRLWTALEVTSFPNEVPMWFKGAVTVSRHGRSAKRTGRCEIFTADAFIGEPAFENKMVPDVENVAARERMRRRY